MAEARAKERWGHTSSLMALIANVNRDPKKHQAFRPDDFSPYAPRRRTGIPLTTDALHALMRLTGSELN